MPALETLVDKLVVLGEIFLVRHFVFRLAILRCNIVIVGDSIFLRMSYERKRPDL